MKQIIIGFFLFLLSLSIFANPIDQKTIDEFKKQGIQVKMGELTGAGSRFLVHSLSGFIHPNGLVMKDDCSEIITNNVNSPKISDILKVKINNEEIDSKEFIGFLIK